MNMKFLFSFGVLTAVLLAPQGWAQKNDGVAVGTVLPAIQLPTPADPAQKGYLGLTGSGTFTLEQIRAEVVIIQIYSMYCPVCQREAPKVDQLFSAIERNENLRRRVKIIGIGAGNSPYEVDFYRQTYQVAFPLFPDADFDIHKQLGQVRTPFFIGLRLESGKTPIVKLIQAGPFESADKFLQEIVTRCRIQ